MEILIFGGLLVAVMVYVSTKIKKNAARAFEREIVETEDFRLIKPDGFIHPLDENSPYAFEAHSKAYGENEEHHTWRSSVDLSVISGSDFGTVSEDARRSVDKILTERFLNGSSPDAKVWFLEGENTENDISFSVFRKVIENPRTRKIYSLKISVLESYLEEYKDKTNEMLDSFVLKY